MRLQSYEHNCPTTQHDSDFAYLVILAALNLHRHESESTIILSFTYELVPVTFARKVFLLIKAINRRFTRQYYHSSFITSYKYLGNKLTRMLLQFTIEYEKSKTHQLI